jgi:hypothetical protein
LLSASGEAADNSAEMNTSRPALDLLGRTRRVVAYQHDPGLEGRPIGMMLAGGILAIVAGVLCARLVFSIWYLGSVEAEYGIYGVSVLFCLFVLGTYFFCLAYELYDVPKALRLTLVFALFAVVALAVMIGALIALAVVENGATVAVSQGDKTRAFGTAMSFAGSGSAEDEDAGKHATEVPGFAMVTCRHCGRDFFPVPPNAVCPWCDTPFLDGGSEGTPAA